VRMYIDKFGGVVKINEDHPLAVAQRERDAAKEGLASPPIAPSVTPEPPATDPPAAPPRSRERRRR